MVPEIRPRSVPQIPSKLLITHYFNIQLYFSSAACWVNTDGAEKQTACTFHALDIFSPHNTGTSITEYTVS